MQNRFYQMFFLCLLVSSFSAIGQGSLIDLMNKGKSEIKRGAFPEAKITLESALSMAIYQNDIFNKSKIQNNLGVVHWNLESYQKSVLYYQMALETNQASKNDTLIAQSQYNLGLTLKKLGNNDLAIQNFLEASRGFERLKDERSQAHIYTVLGNLYSGLKNYEKAFSYHETALLIYEKTDYLEGLSRSYHNIAQVYLEQEDTKSALRYLGKDRDLKEELGMSTASSSALYGKQFLIDGNLDSAEFYLTESYQKRLKEGNEAKLALAYFHLGDFYYVKNELSNATSFLDKALTIADTLGLKQLLIDVIQLQITINNKIKRYEENNHLYQRLILLKGQVLGEKNIKAIARFDVEYESIKKDNEIRLKKSELKNEVASNEYLNSANNLLLLISVITVVAVVITMLLYINIRRKKTKLHAQNNTLESKNEIISNLHRELNHRMVNYFQMFAGMLRYDRKKREEVREKELLTNYINRINAMSQVQHYLLHENQSSSNIVLLDFYLSNLIDEISDTLNHSEPRVRISKQLDSISLNYDKALRLGIVLNELIQNAFKHAFKDIHDPKLDVSMKNDKGILTLCVKDNGQGIQQKVDGIRDSLGVGLISTILSSVKGEIKYFENEGRGVKIEVNMPK